MSTSRASGAGNGGGVQLIPAGARKAVQSLKETVNFPEAEIYAALKDCNMDSDGAINRLLFQEYTADAGLHPKGSRSSVSDGIDHLYKAEVVQERVDDNIGNSEVNDSNSVSIPRRKLPEDDSRRSSLLENELHQNLATYRYEVPDNERHEGRKMGTLEYVLEIIAFMCKSDFWRMAVLWTISLVFSHLKLFYQSLFPLKSKCYPRSSLKNSTFATAMVPRPICIITGATSGLGAAAAYALSEEGFFVVLVGRSFELLSKVVSDIKSRNPDAFLKAFQVDLSSFISILEFKHSLQRWLQDSNMHSSVQVLINNAGILATSRRFTCEGYDQMLATNYLGAFCLTNVLLPLLENSRLPSRVVNVTSFTHRNVGCRQANREIVSGKFFTKSKDYPFARIYEYSKLCMLLFSYELHRKVGLMKKSQHLSIVAADPGAVQTNIMREIPSPVSTMAFTAMKVLGVLQSSEIGISAIVDAALAPPEVSGVYFFGGKGRSLDSSSLSYDAKLAKDLWDTSCSMFEELHQANNRALHSQE